MMRSCRLYGAMRQVFDMTAGRSDGRRGVRRQEISVS